MQVLCTNQWDEYLNKIPKERKDIYYLEKYVKLYQGNDGEAECVVCIEDTNILLFPYIKKRFKDFYDFETPYGYGGPISNTCDETWNKKAVGEMCDFFSANKFLCGFFRFHPLLSNYKMCQDSMEVIFDRHTVAINTEYDEDSIWTNEIKSKNRNMIRKAEKNGFVFDADYRFEALDEFIELYNATMNRLEADDFYFFNDDYYEEMKKLLFNKGFLGTIRKDGKLVCAAIFMYDGDYGHYHLEGSDREYSTYGINNLLLWKTACEMHDIGIKRFHLGGGYNSAPDNSLLSFKKGFSKSEEDFYIGKKIFREEDYKRIKDEWIEKNPEKAEKYNKFLLCYRY